MKRFLNERAMLTDALWESIVEEGYEPPLTSAQADEIDHRLKAHQRNPDDVVDWKTIKAELDSKVWKRLMSFSVVFLRMAKRLLHF